MEGFNNYATVHETYALTLLLHYIMTGKTNVTKIDDARLKAFVERGTNADKAKRFQTVRDVEVFFMKQIGTV